MPANNPLLSLLARKQIRSRLSAFGEAIGITLAGAAIGVIAVVAIGGVLRSTGLASFGPMRIFRGNAIQVGFLVTALAYVHLRGGWDSYVNFRRPDLGGVGWMIATVVLVFVAGQLLDPVIDFLGIEAGASGSSDDSLAAQPLMWPVFFAVWYLFAAPAEELLYRGVVQGRLRRTFGPALAVVLSGFLFGLMHVPIAALSRGMSPVGQFASALVGGIVLGLAYERTNNLLVPAWAHAFFWSQPVVMAILGHLGL